MLSPTLKHQEVKEQEEVKFCITGRLFKNNIYYDMKVKFGE